MAAKPTEEQQPMGAQGMTYASNGTPAATKGRDGEWSNGMFDCFSPGKLCLLGSCCPCILFGVTQHRAKEPSMSNFSCCNFMCVSHACLSYLGLQCCLQAAKRSDMRERFGIKGNFCGDLCASCWCGCCTLIQEEKEALLRSSNVDITDEKVTYHPTKSMQYP